jgi:hypothetical protein
MMWVLMFDSIYIHLFIFLIASCHFIDLSRRRLNKHTKCYILNAIDISRIQIQQEANMYKL